MATKIAAQWMQRVFVESISSSPKSPFSSPGLGVTENIYLLAVNETPSFSNGRSNQHTRTVKGGESQPQTSDVDSGAVNPSVSFSFDVTYKNIVWALWSLFQNGSTEYGAGDLPKHFRPYTSSDCERWCAVGLSISNTGGEFGDGDGQYIYNGIIRSLSLSTEKNIPLRANIEVIGQQLEYDKDPTSWISTMDSTVPFLYKDLNASNVGSYSSVNLSGYTIKITNNAQPVYRANNLAYSSGFKLGDLEISGSVFMPWGQPSSYGGYDPYTDFNGITDNYLDIYYGVTVPDGSTPSTGDFGIRLNVLFKEPAWTNNVEMGWSIPFEGFDDGTNSSIYCHIADGIDWGMTSV